MVRPGLWFLAPALVVLGIFFFLPIVVSLFLSATDFDMYALADSGNARWVGLANYANLLSDSLFWRSLVNTLYFVCVGGPLTVVVSLGAALLVSSKLTRLPVLWRTIFFAPVVTTLVAVAVVWKYLYDKQYGMLNHFLGMLGLGPIDWLGDGRWAMLAIILLAVWKNFGYNMVIFVAGLQSIPEEMFEAARIDGANGWQTFWNVKLPMLAPTFLFVGVTTMIGYFQLFAEPYVMTQRGPLQSTVSVLYLMYEEGFKWWNLGNASAVAFLLFLLMTTVTSGLLWFARRKGAE
jgi:multiple sugar transport system permease protein